VRRSSPAAFGLENGDFGETTLIDMLPPMTVGGYDDLRRLGDAIASAYLEKSAMSDRSNTPENNKALVQASFDRWRAGTGGPFELLAPDASWTIVGSSPLSKTYPNRQAFLDEVINPFNARMATPLVPSVRGLYADGDMVIILFDAAATTKDNQPYRNTYSWYFRMKNAQVISAIAFFDTREFDAFWNRVKPTP
jgi:ketosteroid isomerase-like protein